jgi:hypothetical protein
LWVTVFPSTRSLTAYRQDGQRPVSSVLINQKLPVGAVDRVIQHRAVKPDLDVLERGERAVQHKGVTDLCGHGVADAFFFAALCDVWPVGVSEHDPYHDARAPLISENPENSCVFGEEQRAVREDADLVLGRFKQPCPDLARNGVGADYPSVLVRKHAVIRGECRPVGLVCGHRGAQSAQDRQLVRVAAQWCCGPESPVESVLVIEILELPKQVQQVTLVPEERAVQELVSARLYPAFHDRIHAGASGFHRVQSRGRSVVEINGPHHNVRRAMDMSP